MKTSSFSTRKRLIYVSACLSVIAISPTFAAGTASIQRVQAGATPFLSTVQLNYSGANVAYAYFGIVPKLNSSVRPLMANYSASYLSSKGLLTSNSVTIPVFGLFAGMTNSVLLILTFTDGSEFRQYQPISTKSYIDPCGGLNTPTVQQFGDYTQGLDFSYMLVKGNCSSNTPTIFDADGQIRWVGTSNTASLTSTLFNNQIYISDQSQGVNRIDLTNGSVTKIGSYEADNITFTGEHNIDPGKNGMVIQVDTKGQLESNDLEIDENGKVLNEWNLGNIIQSAMVSGGDDPTKFVGDSNTDWFHNNATAYNASDNTLIVSSRENFLIAVDYDPPADGSARKIHWILGDTTKQWYQFPSLRKFALTLNIGALPPIGQHAISVVDTNTIMVFNDGLGSSNHAPAGQTRNYSAVSTYRIDKNAMTATEVGYNYIPNPSIYSAICSSAYQYGASHLVSFTRAQAGKVDDIQAFGPSGKMIFDISFPQSVSKPCGIGWNVLPITNYFLY